MPTQETAAQTQIKQAVLDSIRQRPGFVLIEGDPGSGKTFIKSALTNALRGQLLVVDINYSRYSFEELIYTLAERVKARFQESNLESAINALKQFCRRKAQSGTPLTLVIDDAQYMPIETLESLKEIISEDGNEGLILHGVLLSDHSLKTSLELNFLTDSLVHTTINIPRPSEAEMRTFIRQLISNDRISLSITEDAELEILMGSEGNFRKAKTILKHASEICQQQGKSCIDETMVVDAKSDESGIPILDTAAPADTGAIPDSLQGILSRSLLDTPDVPVLKQRRESNDSPLFVNDLSNESVSPLSTTKASATTNDDQQLFNQQSVNQQPSKPQTQSATSTPKPAPEKTPTPSPSAELSQSNIDSISAPSEPVIKPTKTAPKTTLKKSSPVKTEADAIGSSTIGSSTIASRATTIEAPSAKAGSAKPNTSTTSTSTEKTTLSDDSLVLKPEEFLEKQPKTKTKPTQIDSNELKPRRTLPAVAAVLFILILGGLGWLSTQPGFNPEAKLHQLKTLALETYQRFVPSTTQSTTQPNTNDISEVGSSEEVDRSEENTGPATTSTQLPGPLEAFENQKAPITPVTEEALETVETTKASLQDTKTTTAISSTINSNPQTSPSLKEEPKAALTPSETEMSAELDKIVEEVEQRLEQKKDDLHQLRQNAIEDLAKNGKVEVKKTKQTQTTAAPQPKSIQIPAKTVNASTTDIEPAGEETAQTAILEIEDLLNEEAKNAQMLMLEKKAKIHIDNYRYTIPENDNAVITLRRIQSLDTDNRWAKEQLNWIRDQYLRRAESASSQGNRIVATQNYGRLLWIDPQDKEVKAAISKLSK